jgi:chloramphenicol-sensitive protein RarD
VNTGPDTLLDKTRRRGVMAALAAYIFWGLAPIYFKFIQTVPALEIIAHRILWSIPLLTGFLLVRDGRAFWSRVRLPWRSVMTLLLSGVLLATNWLVFVWAISHEQILATSLGYFTGPLVNFLLGFLFLHERLTRIQLFGVLIAAAGTVYLTWFLGTPPWISLGLAFSFGFYGLIRKTLNVGPMVGLLWEALLLVIPAIVFMAWSHQQETLAFASVSTRIDFLLVLSGLVTILPLIWFNVAARSLTLSTLGFFQYLAPSLSFMIAVFLYQESFTLGHAVAFGCIWFALAMVSAENLSRRRRIRIGAA